MSKKNKEIAQKITDAHAVYEPGEEGGFYVTLNNSIGFRIFSEAKTKKVAGSHMVEHITQELDSENLVLSDTWIEDNLE